MLKTNEDFNRVLEIAAAYIRVSTDDQIELSPDAQLREILKAAKADGYVIPKEFIFIEDKGRSGRRADNRPAFQRMISMAKQQPAPFKRLYLWKFSRFARNQEESTFYKGILRRKCNIEVKSVSEPIMEGMFGRLIEMIIEWFDEYYSINLSGEVMRGMTEKALRGGYQATTPLGYQYNGPGTIPTIHEQEACIVRTIFCMYLSGIDCTGIARYLNDNGYKTKRGNDFELRVVKYILQNPFYTGKIRWNRAPHSAYHDNPDEEIIIADGQHTPLISAEDFTQVQNKLRSEKKAVKARSVSSCRHWLSGLLKCPVCNSNLSFNAAQCDYFQCWKYAKGQHKISASVSAHKASQALLESMKQVIDNHFIEYDYCPPKSGKDTSKATYLQAELDRVSIKEKRIKDAYENGIDTIEEYSDNKSRLKNERERILDELQNISEAEQSQQPTMDDILVRISTVYELLADPAVDYIIKGNAVRSIIKKIVYDKEKNTFYFTYYA